MTESLLQHFWYLIVGVALIAYVVLDGFDLGAGMLHLFTKKDRDRRIVLNAIGPVWDGNEVWLVIVGGALFAGFPSAYATVFSGFYDLVMVFLVALIFRAVAIEFRSRQPSTSWRKSWDAVFAVSSFAIAFGGGVTLGNFIQGVPLDANKNFTGTLLDFLTPYPVLIGFLSVALLFMHGAIYLVMKTEGELQELFRLWAMRAIAIFVVFYFFATSATLIYMPYMADRIREMPWLSLVAALAFLFFFTIPYLFSKNREGWAFIFSCLGIASLTGLFGVGTYPVLVRSSLDPQGNSWTLFNASSSFLTLKLLAVIVLIGVPLVLAYGVYIYRVFKGKVKLGPSSY